MRPERIKLTTEESVKRMDAFPERAEQIIDAVRKSKRQAAEIRPGQTIEEMATRHRARMAADSAEGPSYADVDLPFVDDGADW